MTHLIPDQLDPDDLRTKAAQFFLEGNYEDAIRGFELQVKIDEAVCEMSGNPKRVPYAIQGKHVLNLAFALYAAGNYDEALTQARRGEFLGGANSDPYKCMSASGSKDLIAFTNFALGNIDPGSVSKATPHFSRKQLRASYKRKFGNPGILKKVPGQPWTSDARSQKAWLNFARACMICRGSFTSSGAYPTGTELKKVRKDLIKVFQFRRDFLQYVMSEPYLGDLYGESLLKVLPVLMHPENHPNPPNPKLSAQFQHNLRAPQMPVAVAALREYLVSLFDEDRVASAVEEYEAEARRIAEEKARVKAEQKAAAAAARRAAQERALAARAKLADPANLVGMPDGWIPDESLGPLPVEDQQKRTKWIKKQKSLWAKKIKREAKAEAKRLQEEEEEEEAERRRQQQEEVEEAERRRQQQEEEAEAEGEGEVGAVAEGEVEIEAAVAVTVPAIEGMPDAWVPDPSLGPMPENPKKRKKWIKKQKRVWERSHPTSPEPEVMVPVAESEVPAAAAAAPLVAPGAMPEDWTHPSLGPMPDNPKKKKKWIKKQKKLWKNTHGE